MKFTDTLKELEAKATDGPWKVRKMRGDCFVEGNKVQGQTIAGDYKTEILSDGDYDEKLSDAELIAYLRNHAKEIINLVEAAEKVSVNIVDGQSMRVSIEDLIALKNTVAALNKE